MMKLYDCVDIISNTDNCVVLKVRDNQEFNLIALGYFKGNETMFRICKDEDLTCTIWHNDGKSFTWNHRTMVTDSVKKIHKMIMKCVYKDCGIYLNDSVKFWDSIGTLDI